ncbi:MAG: hypothetical protein INR62_10975 [Rhodospirillales bacterium]|nr:hypothetical protein [Acetobacter sp.]
MTKKPLLLAPALGGMLLLNAHTMPAPSVDPMLKETQPVQGQDPLDAARDALNLKKIQAMQRSLTAVLSTDAAGKHPAVNFTPNDRQIFLVWHDRTGAKGDWIRVSWLAESVDGVAKGQVLSDEEETLPSNGPFKSSFFLRPAKAALPLGVYRANLYKNTTLVRTLKFTVKPGTAKS